jgi:hypothetical protein
MIEVEVELEDSRCQGGAAARCTSIDKYPSRRLHVTQKQGEGYGGKFDRASFRVVIKLCAKHAAKTALF